MKPTTKDTPDDAHRDRICPGERYQISGAICRARQTNSYPKCWVCPHQTGSTDRFASGDPKIKKNIIRSHAIAGETPLDINEYVMRKIGAAVAQFFKTRVDHRGRMVIACDRRENSRNLSRIFGEGVKAAGMRAVHLGPVMPDMLRFALQRDEMSAAAFISGCNARLEINGVRIIERNGRLLLYDTGLEKIGLIARRMKQGRTSSQGRDEIVRILPEYSTFVLRQASALAPMTVAVDCSCGIAGEIIPYVLGKTPLQVIKSHGEPDGRSELLGLRFPAGEVNTAAAQAIRAGRAQLGMAVDYDGDVCVFYDENGQMLRNDVAASLIAQELLAAKPGVRIAYDLRSTAAFREDVRRSGGQAVRISPSVGTLISAVADKGAEYAFDLGGRHCFRAFHGGESPLTALLLLCSAVSRHQKPLSALAQRVCRYASSGVLSYEMPSSEQAEAAVEELKNAYSDAEQDDLDGRTFRFPSWWFHVKHIPQSRILKVCVEGRSADEERTGRDGVQRVIRRFQ